MKKFRSLTAVVTIIVIAVMSCSKGDTGPAGATGPAGPSGPDSVVYSPWINLNFAMNTANNEFEDTIIAPTLTQAILDKGMILTYVNFQDSLGIYHVYPTSAPIFYNTLYEDYSVGKINIIAANDFTGLPYRYVTIPGSLVTGNSADKKVKGFTPSELKVMSYEQVKQVLAQ